MTTPLTTPLAVLLDLSNLVGGLLLAADLLRLVPGIGDPLARAAAAVVRLAPVVGVLALVAGGYHLLVHLVSGPRVLHFEVVGIGVGVALLWDRLTGRPRPWAVGRGDVTGVALVLAVLGSIAILVGVQGLLTPDG